MDNSTKTALETFKELRDTLNPILRPESDISSDKAVNPEFITPLAQNLNSIKRAIDDLIGYMRDVRNRLEL